MMPQGIQSEKMVIDGMNQGLKRRIKAAMSRRLGSGAKEKTREITPVPDEWPAHNIVCIVKNKLVLENIAVGQKGKQEYKGEAKDTVSRQ
jgi:hypothetical protein